MSRILRLFAVRKETEETHPPEGPFYSDQHEARRYRDLLIEKTGEPHVVCPGPDHKRYKNACQSA